MIDLSKGSDRTYVVEERHGLIPPCIVCGKFEPVKLDGRDYFAFFVKGEVVQEVFNYLSAEEREILITGIHPACWSEMMGRLPEAEEEF